MKSAIAKGNSQNWEFKFFLTQLGLKDPQKKDHHVQTAKI